MLTEGALAVLVIMACVAGLGAAAWSAEGTYANWSNLNGQLSAQLAAVVEGGAAFLGALGINLAYGRAFIAVAIVAFALTTLDSATRLLRYNVEEIFRSIGLSWLANRYVASLVAVTGIGFFALLRIVDPVTGVPRAAGFLLWQMFGTTNQLLAGLTLLTVSLFLFKLARPVWYTLVPMFAMLSISLLAMVMNLRTLLEAEGPRNWPLIVVNSVVLAMTAWMIVEAILSFARGRGGLDLEHVEKSDVRDEQDGVTASTHLT
jgi:carbon starvation protein